MNSTRRDAAARALVDRSMLKGHYYFEQHANPTTGQYNWTALAEHHWGSGGTVLIEALRLIVLGHSQATLQDLWKLDEPSRKGVIAALNIFMTNAPASYVEVDEDNTLFSVDPISGAIETTKHLLEEVAPYAHARRTDPSTSFEAAQSIRNVTETHERILELLKTYGPQTDEQLLDLWNLAVSNGGWPTITESGLRSRRAELKLAGYVEDSGDRGTTEAGRACIIWKATDKRVAK